MTGRIVGISLAALALAAPSAFAAANHNGTLAKIGDKFEWSDNNNRFALGTDRTAPPVDMCADPGFPCDTTYSAESSSSLMVELSPRFSITGLPALPSTFSNA